MSISNEIQKLQTNLTNSYEACSDKGATMPASQNFDNLADCIDSIPSGVNNVDWDKIGYVFGGYITDRNYYDKILGGKVYARNGVYPRGTADETYTTKFVNFSQPFEINIEFTAPTETSHNHVLFGNGYTNQYFRSPACEYQANTANVTFWAGLSTSGSTWDYGLVFTPDEISKVAGDTYNVNYKYDGSRFILSITHNDITLTKSVEVVGTPYYSTNDDSNGTYFNFGANAGNSGTVFEGSFHAWNTYIKQNDVLVWGCEEGQVLNKYPQANIVKHGELEERKDVIIDNFSTSNYGYKSIPTLGNKPWELECEFLSNSISVDQEVIAISTRGASPFYFLDGYIKLFLSSNGSSWDIAGGTILLSLSESTTYHMKISYDTIKYVVSRYIGDTWQTLATVNSSTPLYSDGNLWIGINQRGTSPNYPFKGSINLSKCSLKVDGETVWQGVVPQGSRG